MVNYAYSPRLGEPGRVGQPTCDASPQWPDGFEMPERGVRTAMTMAPVSHPPAIAGLLLVRAAVWCARAAVVRSASCHAVVGDAGSTRTIELAGQVFRVSSSIALRDNEIGFELELP